MLVETTHLNCCDLVDKYELIDFIYKLNPSKCPGADNLGPLILDISSSIIDPLLHIYNLSLSTGVVPNKLKIAKVIPIFKRGDSHLPNNYRPISLLSVFSKLLEKVMYNRLYSFLQTNNILYQYQFGFRENHSTTLALLDVVDQIYAHLDKHESVVGVYLDLEKAFDTVNHAILLHKLYNYGIRGVVYEWFRNYLHNRTQFVTVNECNSEVRNIKHGVPQGSLLGPLLFLIALVSERLRPHLELTQFYLPTLCIEKTSR